MRIKFFQSSSSTSSNKGGATALDDASFISSSSGASQSSWHQQQRAATEPRRGKSPYYQQDSPSPQQNRPKTLNTVMQLFDHDSQQSLKRNSNNNNNTSTQNNNISSIDNPYRIKANGAVVMNRTTHITDSDDLLFGTSTTSGIGLSSHISTTSTSLEASSITTATNPSISQPITTAPFFEPEDVIQDIPSTSSSGSSSSNSNSSSSSSRNDNINDQTTISSAPKTFHQSTKMRMESNSSRSTFPIHDTTRFSMDGDSQCSMESWTSSMIMELLEDNNHNNSDNNNYLPNEQNHHHHHHHHHHHVTALSPPPRNTTKKWERGRVYSGDVDDICEALTTMNSQEQSLLSPPLSVPQPSTSSSSSSSLHQKQQQQYHFNYHEQDESLNNWQTMFELVNQENIRLRHQLQREQKEHDENYKHQTEILVNTRRENRYLKSALSRIQMLSNTDAAYNKEKRRRQSTGEITMLFSPLGEEKTNTSSRNSNEEKEPIMTLSNRTFQGSSVTLTYERKIKILLDEIEGLQAEEEMMYTRRSKLATKNNMLERQLLAREESIKQLEHDLRLMRLQM